MELMPISQITTDNKYLRLDTDVSELEKSIQAIGLISPVIINEKNELLAGARRYQAMKNLGRDEILAIKSEQGLLEQELISIDENLVRKDLNNVELEAHLRRAKELYQELAVQDTDRVREIQEQVEYLKENMEEMAEVNAEPPIEKLASEMFVKEVSEKTGMSPRQIHQAITRDEKSSHALKEARNHGELSISQANEVIKLEEEEQEVLLPKLKDRTVSEIRRIVKEAKVNGMDSAIHLADNPEPNAREIKQLLTQTKKLRQIVSRLELERVEVQGANAQKLMSELKMLNDSFKTVLPELDQEEYMPMNQTEESQADGVSSFQ